MEARPAAPNSSNSSREIEDALRHVASRRLYNLARLAVLVVALVAVVFSFIGQIALYDNFRDRALRDPITLANLGHLGLSVQAFSLYLVALGVLIALGCYAVATIIAVRRSHQPMALFVALLLVLLGATFSGAIGAQGSQPVLVWLNSVLSGLSFETIFLLLYLFPDGRFQPRWTRWPALASLLLVIPASLFPGSRFGPDTWPAGAYALLVALLLASGVYAQVYRYRRISEYVARQQTKWVILGFSIALSLYLVVGLLAQLWSLFHAGTVAYLVATAIQACGMLLIPAAFGIAILRYHLWNIDVIIGRTLVYGTLTAILSGLYASLVGLFQRLFLDKTGSSSNWAIVLTTLIVAASFTPIKNGVQLVVDRRFKPAPAPALATVAGQISPSAVATVAASEAAAAQVGPPAPADAARLEELVNQLASLRAEVASHSATEHELRALIGRLESRLATADSTAKDDQPTTSG